MQLLIKDLSFSKTLNEEWIKQNCYIAGGACVSNATRSPINDVDIYFKTKEARDFFIEEQFDQYIKPTSKEWMLLMKLDVMAKTHAIEAGDEKTLEEGKVKFTEGNDATLYQIYVDEWISVPQPLFEKQKWMFANGYDYVILERNHYEVYGGLFLGNKSITYKHNDMTYQFILRFYGEPEKMMNETFDFQHCKIAYDLATNKYIASEETWKTLAAKEVKYINSYYPVSSLKRLFKYEKRGYKYSMDEFVKIIRDIHKTDVDNKYVMEDQLIGYYEDFDYNRVFCGDDVFWVEEGEL